MKTLRTPFLAAALLTGVAAVRMAPALAQPATAPANATAPSPAQHQARPRIMPGQLVEGRIAFLKTELKITPRQEPEWQKVAAAMRQNADALDRGVAEARAHHGRTDVVERMAIRGQFARVRADNDARLLAAFKPLYASLSPAQRQMASALLGAEHGSHHGWHHRV
jgi:periplasmic protein CpxP/Spy